MSILYKIYVTSVSESLKKEVEEKKDNSSESYRVYERQGSYALIVLTY